MKKALCFLLLLLSATSSYCQKGAITPEKKQADSLKITTVTYEGLGNEIIIDEQMPEFPGGDSERIKFVQKNLIYPKAVKKGQVSGTVYLEYIVEEDGSLSNIKVLRGISNCPNCDKEAIRVVSKMPKWIPGKQLGVTFPMKVTLPIKFQFSK
jgi:TonB family protein